MSESNLYITVHPELKVLVDKLPSRKIAYTVRLALGHWMMDSHLLFKVTFIDRDVVYYGHTLKSDYYSYNDYILELKDRDGPLAHDFDIFPLCSFRIEVISEFGSLDMLLEYRDFLMNDRLDKGLLLYNDEVIKELSPRYLRIMLDYSVASKFGRFCKKKGLTINAVLKSCIKKLLR